MKYQLLTFGGLLINVLGLTWDWTAHINLDMFYCTQLQIAKLKFTSAHL